VAQCYVLLRFSDSNILRLSMSLSHTSGKFAIERLLNTLPHLKCFATLPCEALTSVIKYGTIKFHTVAEVLEV